MSMRMGAWSQNSEAIFSCCLVSIFFIIQFPISVYCGNASSFLWWSVIFLFLNFQNHFWAQRSPVAIAHHCECDFFKCAHGTWAWSMGMRAWSQDKGTIFSGCLVSIFLSKWFKFPSLISVGMPVTFLWWLVVFVVDQFSKSFLDSMIVHHHCTLLWVWIS